MAYPSATEAMVQSMIQEAMRPLHERIAQLEQTVLQLTPKLALIIGGASEMFGARLAEALGVKPVALKKKNFSNGNMERALMDSVRGKRVIVVQTGERSFITDPERATDLVSRDFMELLLLVRAARDSALSVCAVCPYWYYSRSDKKDKPRIALGSRLMMDQLREAGADRLVVANLHSMQQVGFGPPYVDQVFAMNEVIQTFLTLDLDPRRLVIAAPDMSATKACNLFAKRIREALAEMGLSTPDFIPVAVVEKGREDDSEDPTVYGIIGEEYVRGGQTCILLDDEALTVGTLAKGAHRLRSAGAGRIFAATTHGIFSMQAMKKLDESPIEAFVTTDSVDLPDPLPSPKIKVVSIVPLVAEALRRIHGCGSISELCE